jgi:hypothetical protein
MIGRICMSKASLGLVLDEKRLKDLMAAGGMQVSCCCGNLLLSTFAWTHKRSRALGNTRAPAQGYIASKQSSRQLASAI